MIKRKEIKELTTFPKKPCISIFIPTSRVNESDSDKIRFKNALQKAEKRLEQFDLTPPEIRKMTGPAENLLDEETFWSHLSDGLAVFLGPNYFNYFELPISFGEQIFAGDHFLVRPLMPMFTGDGRFFVLALSQQEVRFFEGSRHAITPVKISDLVPASREEAVLLDQPQNQIQMHYGSGTRGNPNFHGQGSGKDEDTKRLEEFLRKVDDGLMKMLHDESAPLVIAGVDHVAARYRNLSKYAYVLNDHVSGNPEEDDPVLLHEKAWEKVSPIFDQKRKERVRDFDEKMAEEEASFSFPDILRSAYQGRIESVFIDRDDQVWGTYEPETDQLDLHEERKKDSDDLLDRIAKQTFRYGGTVYNVERSTLPRPSANANALYRY